MWVRTKKKTLISKTISYTFFHSNNKLPAIYQLLMKDIFLPHLRYNSGLDFYPYRQYNYFATKKFTLLWRKIITKYSQVWLQEATFSQNTSQVYSLFKVGLDRAFGLNL